MVVPRAEKITWAKHLLLPLPLSLLLLLRVQWGHARHSLALSANQIGLCSTCHAAIGRLSISCFFSGLVVWCTAAACVCSVWLLHGCRWGGGGGGDDEKAPAEVQPGAAFRQYLPSQTPRRCRGLLAELISPTFRPLKEHFDEHLISRQLGSVS
ncbi:hypothetical protein E2C01_012727 [Portunus trituberculatus]|uniref:Secreted protein n=1 Tax=Portunus trituberculatus TaxID=210409 RepID=A0A5B7DEN1_PORTR|nr:hypothetical protein [Portunus trituberculatus]